ncbi:MAG: SDR family oxidoreductase [Comamonadaceae bacterium]|nr:SDR family oxidoreductase [Comamonadaceae bacterium]
MSAARLAAHVRHQRHRLAAVRARGGAAHEHARTAAPGGAIVNLSSAAARLGAPGQYVDYAAAKGAIDAFTHRPGAARWPPRASASTPCARASSTPRSTPAAASPTARSGSRRTVPMQRAGTADEVAQAIALAAVGRIELRPGQRWM